MFHLTTPSEFMHRFHCQQLLSLCVASNIEMHIDSQFANGSLKKCTLTIFNSCKTHYSSLLLAPRSPRLDAPQRFCCMIAIYQRAKLRHLKNQFEYFFSPLHLSSSAAVAIPALAIFAIHFGCSFEGNRI